MSLSRKTIADLLWAMTEAREHLDGEIDIVDGDYGEPAPNRAMTICNQLDEAIVVLEREFDVLTETFETFPRSTQPDLMRAFDSAIEAIKRA